jgi:hypothetical protein
MVLFTVQLWSETILILRIMQQGTILSIARHVKCPLVLSDFNENWVLSTDFFKNTEISNFMIIRPSGGSRVVPWGRSVGRSAAALPCTLNHGSPTRPHAARGHFCTLCTYDQNCTTRSRTVRYTAYCYAFTCGPWTSPQYRIWPCTKCLLVSVCHSLQDRRTLTGHL